MKNKPERHKESNVFRFKTFGDRINDIDLRRTALYHIKHVNEETLEDVEETEFYQTYVKWTVLNLTEEYNVFQKKIRNIVTLPQLIHKKDFVTDALLNALEKGTVLALQPLLEFVVALAKDLREEFYPYFPSFLERLIRLLNTKEADQLEWTLICLAYLFKILKPFLKKDITIVFNSIIPLLDNRKPEHVTNFAAECFSFVARDIKDKEKFLSLILNGLEAHKNGVAGCARLIVEIIRGVNGQFHSCAELFLRICLESLAKPKQFQQAVLHEVLTDVVTELMKHIHPANMQIFWHVSYQTLEAFLKESAVLNDAAINKLLILMGLALETRDGKFLTNTSDMVTVLVTAIDTPQISEECLRSISEIVAVLLLSKNLLITQLDASRILKKVVTIPSASIFESFVWNSVHYSQFEVLVLPEFLRYLDGKHFNVDSMELLAKIIMAKSPLCRDGLNLADKKIYPIRMRSEKCLKKIEEIILNADDDFDENVRELLLAVIIYPHIIGVNGEKVLNKLTTLIEGGLEALKIDTNDGMRDTFVYNKNKRLIFILSILIENQIHLRSSVNVTKGISLRKIVNKLLPYCLCDNYRYIHALRVLDLVITFESNQRGNEKSSEFNFELFTQIHDQLSNNMASRYHDVRLLTVHLFDRFSDEIKISGTNYAIYRVFYAIESIEPTIQSYREQLLHFQKIEANAHLLSSLSNVYAPCKLDPLKFLFGCLYINFSLLWKPVMELIEMHFHELDIADFWPIYKWKIDETTALQRVNQTDDLCNDEEFIAIESCLSTEYSKCWQNDGRDADLVNYRILLWRLIPTLGMLSEVKNREIITIFLDFIEFEHRKNHDHDSFTWNIQKKSVNADDAVQVKQDEDDDNDDDDAELSAVKDSEKNAPKGTQRTLITMLQVFVNQSNPKQLYREPELATLYQQLLSHRNAAVQKLALDCIFAYKHKYLLPYKEHLYNMVDDGKFKEAITNFKIDKESNIVQEEHRPQLMPIVMRILFSKMLVRVGGQKTTNQLRKSLVMRFLGGCHESEILLILSMSFWLFEADFKDDAKEMCLSVIAKTDLTNVLSPRKLQSSLDLIDIIQGEFSGLMSDKFLRYILNLLLVIGSIAHGVLQQHEQPQSKISSKMATSFRTLRNTSIQNLQRFFNHFDTYTWSDNEIDAIFLVFVSPMASKLTIESVSAVSPLLKLFATFAKYPRIFILLTRYTKIATDDDSTPLKLMMDLLVEPKARPLVCLTIMETIQNLLTLSDDTDTSLDVPAPIHSLDINHCRPIEFDRLKLISNADSLNFGSKILLPYLPKILQKFKMNLKKRRGLTKRDLLILSKITELISDAETCNTLLTVLLPILVRKSHSNAGEESLTQMVNTIINLFQKIERPERHIRNIAPMFEQITAVGPRKRLCDLLQIICDRCNEGGVKKENLKLLVSIVSDLNAWDRRWVEQPDYEKRLGAYKRISELLAENRVDINFGLLVIYHSFYFIKHDKDMALRDSASYHLKTLVPALIRKYQREQPTEIEYLIGTVILNLVRRTLRDRNDTVRNEGILLLGEMARECPDAHPVLEDLNSLTCKEDREIDFFDNVTHLQSLRHGKALLRFCSIAKTYEKAPNPRTLTQFILPLASMYISSEKYASKHGLVTSAIETIGAVCHLLPWHQYESILKYYLKCMRFNSEYQKQMVRIVMHILDAFHFDLSKANVTSNDILFAKELTAKNAEITKETEKKELAKDDGEEDVVIEEVENEDSKFDEELDAINMENDKEMDEDDDADVPIKRAKVFVYDQPIVLSHSVAKKLVHTIATGLIPTLNNSITALSTFESFHKLNKKKRRSEREEEEILRVPIALAMVKLLQKLPKGMLEQNISGILVKVCMFLRSPLVSVRMATRDILKNIMLAIGSVHLEMLLNHMTSLLTRGFQVHVLTITVHSILDALKTSLKNGIMDKCLQYVLDVCLRDIFGQTGEEKEITKIGKHTPEAKPHNKSFLTLNICANNITESCLLDLLIPFKDNLAKSQTKKVVVRVQECFQKIVAGLTANKQISIESMLMFIYGTVSESIPDLLPGIARPVLSDVEKAKIKRERPDCFLIPDDPASGGRSGAVKKMVVTNVKANAHVLIELGLELLQMTLKRGKLLKINYQPFIDPIIPILYDSLTSAHVRVTTFSLKCLSLMLSKEMTCTKMNELMPAIVEQIFKILHKYVAANTDMSNENFNLVQSSFKTLVNILRYVPSTTFNVNEDQLKMLLFYIEQYLNVNETTKQTISFSLLKVILSRRLVIREMNNVLMQVARLAIQSESDVARQESKGIIVNYLMEYPLGKKVKGFLEFFITNLSYELPPGRESAINILHSIAKRFPPEYLNRHCGLIFVSCGSRLINDESAECREQIAECLETLLARIDANNRDEMFTIVLKLLNDEQKPSHREMGALLCSRFINTEKKKFEARIENVLPILIAAMSLTRTGNTNTAGQFVRVKPVDDSDDEANLMEDDSVAEMRAEDKQRAVDHQLIQVQNTILKIFETYPTVIANHPQYVDELAYESQKLLAYEHTWVRLNALKSLEIILQNIDVDEIHKILMTGARSPSSNIQLEYLYGNPEQEIKSLTLDLCAQLLPDQTEDDMADSVTTDLLFIANIVKDIPFGNEKKDDDIDGDDDAQIKQDKRKINLAWLLRRMRYVIHAEVAKAPHSIILRSSVFGWIEGLVELLPTTMVERLAYTILSPLVREMSEEDQNIDVRLRKIAIRVGDAVRGKIGDDEYNILRAQIQKKLMIKRAERKKILAMEKVNDPVRAAKRMQGIKDRKKLAKRRNFDVYKGRSAPRTKRMKVDRDDY